MKWKTKCSYFNLDTCDSINFAKVKTDFVHKYQNKFRNNKESIERFITPLFPLEVQ